MAPPHDFNSLAPGEFSAWDAVDVTLARMAEIEKLIGATSQEPFIERSSLIGVACSIIAVQQGMSYDRTTLNRFARLMFARLVPIVEEVARDFKA